MPFLSHGLSCRRNDVFTKVSRLLICNNRNRKDYRHRYFYNSSLRYSVANNPKPLLTIGINHETYCQWERRAPLTPKQIQQLIEESYNNNNLSHHIEEGRQQGQIRFLVQPSPQRVFTDQEYKDAGAVVTNDLSTADVIIGVKRPKVETSLLPKKTYIFFSHVMKGQPENMNLLYEILNKNIQLIDYERIIDNTITKKQRLVSFGYYAGLAGTFDTFHALGRKLLYKYGASTPFLAFPSSSIMFDNVEDAKHAVIRMGQRIADNGINIPEPIVFAVTGSNNGAVHKGVIEILTLLPHEIINVKDLRKLFEEQHQQQHQQQNHSSIIKPQRRIYICKVEPECIYQRYDYEQANTNNDRKFSTVPCYDRNDYRNNASKYRSLFAKRVAPYVQVIMNATYWDARYPRLLTKRQMKRIYDDGNHRLLLVADISCDVHGSIEFLERSTTIEKPFFTYDPVHQTEVSDDIVKNGIGVLGVDILPSELPRESTVHFGNAVKGVIKELINAKIKQDKNVQGIDPSFLSTGLANACITNIDGTLTFGFRYLETMMHRTIKEIKPSKHYMILALKGHLFDSGLINQILDVIEHHGHGVVFEECNFPAQCGRGTTKSSVVLKIDGNDQFSLSLIESKVKALVNLIQKADADCERLDHEGNAEFHRTAGASVEAQHREKHVLLLGAGRVSKAFVEFLGRSNRTVITVASDNEEDANAVASVASKGNAIGLDIVSEVHRLSELIEESDLVVSLLPAPMHPPVALECILHQKHLITASYESEEMRAINERAKAAGIIILNEVGLDPGLDHMSAMSIISDIQERGGLITRFSSVCGGLPSPEAANNPLKYKFSWSPRGVIRACQNPARYRMAGKVFDIPGDSLLKSAEPLREIFPDLGLECIPNRNSLQYENTYGIEGASTIFRGTLRYHGLCKLISIFQEMGLLSEVESDAMTWGELLANLKDRRGQLSSLNEFVLACAGGDVVEAKRAIDCLQWLGMIGHGKVSSSRNAVDNFCDALESKLAYTASERDMVIMHHSIDAIFEDGSEECHQSSLQVFGDEKHSAMSKTVGFPTAASAELILEGALVGVRGLVLPTDPKVYLPVIESLALEGIVFDEKMTYHPLATSSSLLKNT